MTKKKLYSKAIFPAAMGVGCALIPVLGIFVFTGFYTGQKIFIAAAALGIALYLGIIGMISIYPLRGIKLIEAQERIVNQDFNQKMGSARISGKHIYISGEWMAFVDRSYMYGFNRQAIESLGPIKKLDNFRYYMELELINGEDFKIIVPFSDQSLQELCAWYWQIGGEYIGRF